MYVFKGNVITTVGEKTYENEKMVVAGRLTKDAYTSYNEDGSIKSVSFDVASAGNKKGETDYYRIVVMKNSKEFCSKYMKKGTLIVVAGNYKEVPYTHQGKEGSRTGQHLLRFPRRNQDAYR